MERLDTVDKPRQPWELRLSVGSPGRTGDVVARLDDVVVERGDFTLGPIDLVVGTGERVALVGANGSGKTTLLRALAGLDRPLAGTVRWSGGPLPSGAGRVRRVGVAFQTELASRFTVRELVALGLALDRPPGPAERRAVDDALALTALGHLADRPCTAVSGGEAQRALLARALVAAPRLVLLDEPTNHLDPAGRAMIQALIDRIARARSAPGDGDGAAAVVIATHDLELAARCDRIALVADRRLAALGAPAAVLTPGKLAAALGVVVRRLDDPDGGPPALRIVGAAPRSVREVAA